MQLTRQQTADLARFGCAFQSKRGLLCTTWTAANPNRIFGATIRARVILPNCPNWPLLCLALEVSAAHVLPQYYYFPFNLRNSAHANYISVLSQTGKLRVEFLSGRKTIVRDHEFTPSQCTQIKQMYAQASKILEDADENCSFSDALMGFERIAWIPQFFERALPDGELARTLESIKTKAANVTPENRALARDLIRGLGNVLKNHFGEFVGKHTDVMEALRMGVLALFDLKQEFGNDYDRFVDVIADAIVVDMNEESLRNAQEWPFKLESLINLLKQLGSAPQAEQEKVRSELMESITSTINVLSSGRNLSLSMLQNLLLPLRPLLPAQPGRPSKDYSREYQRKTLGSWTEVTRMHLKENRETRDEFGGRDFDSLTPQEQESLKNRIREGVRSYAERTGKPFPVPK